MARTLTEQYDLFDEQGEPSVHQENIEPRFSKEVMRVYEQIIHRDEQFFTETGFQTADILRAIKPIIARELRLTDAEAGIFLAAQPHLKKHFAERRKALVSVGGSSEKYKAKLQEDGLNDKFFDIVRGIILLPADNDENVSSREVASNTSTQKQSNPFDETDQVVETSVSKISQYVPGAIRNAPAVEWGDEAPTKAHDKNQAVQQTKKTFETLYKGPIDANGQVDDIAARTYHSDPLYVGEENIQQEDVPREARLAFKRNTKFSDAYTKSIGGSPESVDVTPSAMQAEKTVPSTESVNNPLDENYIPPVRPAADEVTWGEEILLNNAHVLEYEKQKTGASRERFGSKLFSRFLGLFARAPKEGKRELGAYVLERGKQKSKKKTLATIFASALGAAAVGNALQNGEGESVDLYTHLNTDTVTQAYAAPQGAEGVTAPQVNISADTPIVDLSKWVAKGEASVSNLDKDIRPNMSGAGSESINVAFENEDTDEQNAQQFEPDFTEKPATNANEALPNLRTPEKPKSMWAGVTYRYEQNLLKDIVPPEKHANFTANLLGKANKDKGLLEAMGVPKNPEGVRDVNFIRADSPINWQPLDQMAKELAQQYRASTTIQQ